MVDSTYDTSYIGAQTRPDDLDEFWDQVVCKVKEHPLEIKRSKTNYQYGTKSVDRITFHGLDQTEIAGWYLYDASAQNSRCIVTTHGYRSARKTPHQYLYWLDIGTDVLVYDVRLQSGETGSNTPIIGPIYGEVITANILDLKTSYLYLIYTDILIATRAVLSLGYTSYVLEGTSQAGGLAIAAGCIMHDADAVLANVPSCSDLDQRIQSGRGSFKAFQAVITNNPEDEARMIQNLSYFDTKNLAHRLQCPLFASVGGKDTVCPLDAFLATYNRVESEKYISIYPYSEHDGNSVLHREKEIRFLSEHMKR